VGSWFGTSIKGTNKMPIDEIYEASFFERYLGTTLEFCPKSETGKEAPLSNHTLSLQLVEVKRYPKLKAPHLKREPFSILFEGTGDPCFDSPMIGTIIRDDIPWPDLHVNPVLVPTNNGPKLFLEAVFN
jgi:hypothetical protein